MKIGNILKNLRLAAGLTQEQLGKKVNLTKANISKYESDDIEPNLATLYMFAVIFNCTIDYFFGLVNDPTPPNKKGNSRNATSSKENVYSKDEQLLVESYRALNEEGQEKIIDYVDDLMTSGKYIKSGQLGLAE